MPYPTDPPQRPNWLQALTAVIPMIGASVSPGGAAGLGAFGENYARGAAVAEELRQRQQAQRQREQAELQRLAFEREDREQQRQDRTLEQQLRALKMMESVAPMADAALADAEAAGLVYPDQQAEYASKAIRDSLERYAAMAPALGVTAEQLMGGMGDLRAKASQRMITSLQPLYKRMTDEATEQQIELFRRDPTPRFGGLPFADFESLLPAGARWVPKTPAVSKGASLEADLADARRRGDTRAVSDILGLMGRQAAATRKPEAATGDEPTGYTGVGEQILQQLPPDEAAIVKGIADYALDVTKVASTRKPSNAESERKRLIKLVMQYDPTYDMNLYRQVADTRREFTVGKGAQNVRSLNTAIGHIGDLAEKARALENSPVKLWNKAKQVGLTQTGDPRVTNFLTTANAVEGELATLFKGMGATDQEIKAWREVIDAAGSPEQLEGFVQTAVQLAFSRLGALKDQYVKGVRKSDRQFLNAKSRSILDKLGIDWRAWDDEVVGPVGAPETVPVRGTLGPNPYRK